MLCDLAASTAIDIYKSLLKIYILVPLIYIRVPLSFANQDIDAASIPQILFENINYLMRNKKLFGKSMPIKPLDVLVEYHNKTLENLEQYIDFFNKIKNAL